MTNESLRLQSMVVARLKAAISADHRVSDGVEAVQREACRRWYSIWKSR